MQKIKRRRDGEIVPQRKNKEGHMVVDLQREKGTKVKTVRVDHLVWETFNRKLRMDEDIEHIDGNKENCALENLRVVRKGN